MTTYYISSAGSDSNNGLGADASHATNKPWLTVSKATNTGSTVVPGDMVILGPGVLLNSPVTPIAAISSVANRTTFIGDPLNYNQFKDGSGVLLAVGPSGFTTRTSANGWDGTVSSATTLIRADTNAPKGLIWQRLFLECRADVFIWQQNMGGSTDTDFRECHFVGRPAQFTGGTPTAGMNLSFYRCSGVGTVFLTAANTAAAATANADLNVLIDSCWFRGSIAVSMALSASGGNLAGGVRVKSSFFLPDQGILWSTTASRVSTTTPCRVLGVVSLGVQGSSLSAGTSGQIVDDGYCYEGPGTTRTNVTTGTGSVIGNFAPMLVMPHLFQWGLSMPRADMFAWSEFATTTQRFSGTGETTTDFFNRTARPWGSGASSGYLQTPSWAWDTSSAISVGGTNSMSITGKGENPQGSIWVPVDATATTISVVTKSTSYGGTNYPQMTVVANPDIGLLTDQTVTATSASEQAITSPSFTPTAKGLVEIRLISRSTSTSSLTYFDKLSTP